MLTPLPARARTHLETGSERGRVRWWIYAVLIAVGAASVFPLYWSFVVATKDSGAAAASFPSLMPGSHLLDNLGRVVDTVDFWLAVQNSLIVASTVSVANLVLSTVAGFAFAHLRFPGRNTLFLLVLGTAMVPAQLGVIPLYLVVSELGWYGRLEAVIVPALAGAFGVFWMRQACEEAVEPDLVDAARLDGCSLPRVIWHVVLPAVRPQAVVLAMLTFLASWNDFFWPLIVLDPVESPTVQVVLSELASGYFTDYALMLTGATLGVLPVLLIFVLLARRIVGGIMHGSARGVR
ncbi:MAG: carbohydrate ABC transporter permease [Thermocrispum sp.]